MATLSFTVATQEGSNQFTKSMEFDLDQLRKTPNPRQCLTAHFIYEVRELLKEVDPSFNI